MPSSFADTQNANALLKRALVELNSSLALVLQAQQQDTQSSRLKFHYKWLRSDLLKIKAGIRQKLHSPIIEPRHVKPIKGDYLTFAGHRFP